MPRADGSSRTILVVLSGGPKTPAEIEDAFGAYGRRLPGSPRPHLGSRGKDTRLGRGLTLAMARAVEAGWAAECHHGDEFRLTEAGRAEAGRVLGDLRSRRGLSRPPILTSTRCSANTAWKPTPAP